MGFCKGMGLIGVLAINDCDEIVLISNGKQAIRSPISGIHAIDRIIECLRPSARSGGDKLIGISTFSTLKISSIPSNYFPKSVIIGRQARSNAFFKAKNLLFGFFGKKYIAAQLPRPREAFDIKFFVVP
jgi:hypothetical protein